MMMMVYYYYYLLLVPLLLLLLQLLVIVIIMMDVVHVPLMLKSLPAIALLVNTTNLGLSGKYENIANFAFESCNS